ncbi:hypothetical protein PSHT_10347 [Puccinia striiformis]|uniref:Uncharacterized protein n=1 Tax=Puccinia striiformis TaxID=27350 RepID=A0A2S4VAS1_9BASI|nr:hypothetical protein PSHT_10347 [Puccinia striiformis]
MPHHHQLNNSRHLIWIKTIAPARMSRWLAYPKNMLKQTKPLASHQQESPNHIASLTIDNLDKGTKEDIPLVSIPNHPVEPDHNRADFSPLANCPATDFASTVLKAHNNVSSIPRQVKPSTTVSKEDD